MSQITATRQCADLKSREVKFDALMDHITPQDAWLATGMPIACLYLPLIQMSVGHYARKQWSSQSLFSRVFSKEVIDPRPQLVRPADRSKDQTYYLSAIPERSLARAIFPLESFTKTAVREIAQKWNLPTAGREESMGICFVGEKRKFDTFICE